MGPQQQELHNDNTFGLELLTQCSIGLTVFAKGHESLKGLVYSGQPWEADNDQLRRSSKLILLQLQEKLLNIIYSFTFNEYLGLLLVLFQLPVFSFLQIKPI